MNQPTNQTGTSFTNQQTGTDTNPFTADLKGEFTSNFGTNTNAVSQIFKDGGFASGNNKKWIIIGAVVVVLLLAGGYYMFTSSGDDEFDQFANGGDVATEPVATSPEQTTNDTATADNTAAADQQAGQETAAVENQAGQEQEAANTAKTAQTEEMAQATDTAPAPTGNITLVTPNNGASQDYDETSGPAEFSWQGTPGGYIIFARNRAMKPEIMRVPVSGNSYSFHHPYPGNWYWRVENSEGVSEVRKFVVNPPARRNIALSQPTDGATLAADGGVIAWQPDPENKVAFYRVEFSNTDSWGNPAYRFASSGSNVQTKSMAPGTYKMRLGAFSEVSGRWEYTQPINVTVQ